LILSLIGHLQYLEWVEEMEKQNPELIGLISPSRTYGTLSIFVILIGFYEMTTKPTWIKIIIRIFLVCIVLGATFSGLIPIDGFYDGVYNTAWFSATIALFLLIIRFGKYIKNRETDKHKKASR
tara:strand:- start:35 stop:406 length:372 start_codon:yes stop_codon:yes gene_type:complete